MTYQTAIEIVKRCLTEDCNGCPRKQLCDDGEDFSNAFSSAPTEAVVELIRNAKIQQIPADPKQMLTMRGATLILRMQDGESKIGAEDRLVNLLDNVGIDLIGWSGDTEVNASDGGE